LIRRSILNCNFSIAPCSWGIEDSLNPNNPEWQKVIDDAGKSGFKGIELGPYGYLPTDPLILIEELENKKLELIAGTIYDNLTGSSDRAALLTKTDNICSLISRVTGEAEGRYIVIIDAVKDIRNNTAGHSQLAKRLPAEEWKIMMNNITEISKLAWNKYGIRPVIHPHAGGFLEFRDETEQFLNDVSPETAGLCLDTGHLYYAGDNPGQSLKDYSSRLDYIHFKDINKNVYTKAIEDRLAFFDACNLGVMCSIGKGCVDYSSVFKALNEIGYDGWITIEQERDPKNYTGALNDIKFSHEFLLKTLGIEPK
jgi:inosose dehydratase